MCGCEGSPVVAVASSLLDSEVLNRHMFKEIYRDRNQSPRAYVPYQFTEIYQHRKQSPRPYIPNRHMFTEIYRSRSQSPGPYTFFKELALEFDEEISFLMCRFEGSHEEGVVELHRRVEVLRRCMSGRRYQHRNRSPRPYITLIYVP